MRVYPVVWPEVTKKDSVEVLDPCGGIFVHRGKRYMHVVSDFVGSTRDQEMFQI
jgi:hypothetical protein